MEHGFIKVAAVTPKIRVADTVYNVGQICDRLDEAVGEGARIIVFPELCITGYTCNDLFLQEILLEKARRGLLDVAAHTEGKDALVFVGLPLGRGDKLYNVAAALYDGRILGWYRKRIFLLMRNFTKAGTSHRGMVQWQNMCCGMAGGSRGFRLGQNCYLK